MLCNGYHRGHTRFSWYGTELTTRWFRVRCTLLQGPVRSFTASLNTVYGSLITLTCVPFREPCLTDLWPAAHPLARPRRLPVTNRRAAVWVTTNPCHWPGLAMASGDPRGWVIGVCWRSSVVGPRVWIRIWGAAPRMMRRRQDSNPPLLPAAD